VELSDPSTRRPCSPRSAQVAFVPIHLRHFRAWTWTTLQAYLQYRQEHGLPREFRRRFACQCDTRIALVAHCIAFLLMLLDISNIVNLVIYYRKIGPPTSERLALWPANLTLMYGCCMLISPRVPTWSRRIVIQGGIHTLAGFLSEYNYYDALRS
jgi:hypothetical protein